MKDKVEIVIKCNTVGDLLDELAKIAKDPNLWDVLDATIDGSSGDVFTGFRIVRRTLSDKSKALDFELFED
jgi:hypothetical protein